MTNGEQPNVNARLDDIDIQLEQVGDEIDLIRTIQTANRRETRANSQTAARLERTLAQKSRYCPSPSASFANCRAKL